MFCSKCGNKNDDNSSFCGSCGAPLFNSSQNGSPDINANINNQYQQSADTYYNRSQNSYYNQTANNAPSKLNSMALAGFIVSFIFGPLGLIFSLIGFHQVRVRGERGMGFAIAGIILGCLSVISLIWMIIFVCTADTYELRRHLNDFYYDIYGYDYGISAAKEFLSMIRK